MLFPHRYLILDACCAISLCASAMMEEVIKALNASVAIADYVLDEEILSTSRGQSGAVEQNDISADLQLLLHSGLLTRVSLETEAEETSFVNFAFTLDDGEAITAAIAVTRKWTIATDDRKAISFIRRTAPTIDVVSTLELLKHWADTVQPPWGDVRDALHKIRTQARYEPGPNHTLYLWWQQHLGS